MTAGKPFFAMNGEQNTGWGNSVFPPATRRRRGWLQSVLFVAVGLFAVVAAPALFAQSGGLALSGSLSNDTVLLQNIDGGAPGATIPGVPNPSLGGLSKLTLNFVNRNRNVAKVEGSVALSLLYGSYADAYDAGMSQLLGQNGTGILSLLASNGAAVNVNLRKLYLSIYSNLLDISVGRQIINFGVGTLFSPIDAFSTPTLTDLNFERSGSDVVRIDVPFGEVSGLEAVSTVSDALSGLTSAIKLYTNVSDYDLSAVGLYRGANKELIAGADFKGDLILGIHGEAVQHFLYGPARTYFEGMFGTDYSFSGKLFLSAEYYYNGNPVTPGSLSAADLAAAQQIFLNRHYLYGDVRYILNDLMNVSLSAVYDISGESVLATAQYAYNVVQNGDLLFYVRYMHGDIRSGLPGGTTVQYGAQLKVAF